MIDPLSTTLSALADPTRRAILARLALGEASVNELAAPFDMTLAAVSKHIKVLETAGLISRSRQAQWRPCKLEAGPMRDVAGLVEDLIHFPARLLEFFTELKIKDSLHRTLLILEFNLQLAI